MALRDVLFRRIIFAIFTIFVVLAIDFAIFHMLPGNPIDFLASNPNLPQEAQNIIITKFGLDQPLHIQFVLFISNFVRGDMGISFFYRVDVAPIIMERLVNTLILMIPANIIAIALGIWIGKYSAWYRGKALDYGGWLFALITYAIPTFWLGMIFLLIFGYQLNLFPTDPYNFMRSISNYAGNPVGLAYNTLAHLALPLLVLIIAITGIFALIMRNSLLDTLAEDYMITAKAKGLKPKDQLNKEAVPNAQIPVTTVIAIQFGFVVVGALLIEIVFNYHGIGRLIWDAIGHRDYPILQASFFMFTVVLIFTNLVADFIYFYLDPRIRVSTPTISTEKKEIWWRRLIKKRFQLLLLVLAIVNIIILGFYPTWFGTSLIVSLILILIAKWRPLWTVFSGFLRPYKPANLKHSWDTNKPQLFIRIFTLFAVIGLIGFLLLGIGFLLGWQLIIAPFWSLALIPLSIGIIGVVIGWLFVNRASVRSVMGQVLNSPKGFVGVLLVLFFVGLALFGDIIAPYNPSKNLVGPIFQSPTPLPSTANLLLSVSIGLIVIGVILAGIATFKNWPPIPSGVTRTGYSFLLILIGGFLIFLSLDRSNSLTLWISVILVLIGGYVLVRSMLQMRSTISFSSLRNSMARIVPVIIILIATGILVFTSFAILMDHPTDFSTFHLMGTDQLGRDIFSATIIGVRVTLLVAILATLISIGIGTMLGLLSGYYGGGTDTLIMRFTDIFFVIPAFVLMIIVASVIGSSLLIIMTVIGIFSWATTARIVRGQVLSIKERAYVERVRSVGGGDLYIIFRHILPAVLPVIVAQTILLIINSIFFMISLNFVGIGDPAVISWGSMLFLAQNQGAVSLNLSWLFVPPGLAVVILIVGVALLGFSFDEVTNPRLRRR